MSTEPIPQTCYQIICDAMLDAGKLGQGREPNGEQLAENMRRLNKYVNYLQTQGAILWVQEDVDFGAPALQAGVNVLKLGPNGSPATSTGKPLPIKPRRVIEGYYTDSNQTRRPLGLMSRNEYDSLSTTSTQGTITSFYPDKQFAFINVYLWMTPDAQAATGTVHLIVDLQIPNFIFLTDQMIFPPEWALCLEWGLADQISTGMPQEIVDRCAAKLLTYEAALLNWDIEDASTTFQPDPRGGYTGKRVGKY